MDEQMVICIALMRVIRRPEIDPAESHDSDGAKFFKLTFPFLPTEGLR